MKVLVVGATGEFAGLVVPELTKRGVVVRALLHDEAKSEEARHHGATEIATADLNDPETLGAAVAGVDGVFHTGPGFALNEAEMGVYLVQAADAANVRKFVFSGVIHPTLSLTNHVAKRPVEQALCESGLIFTVLQPAAFFQNFAASWQTILKQGSFTLPYSAETKVCYVDYRDVAEAAALALTTDKLDFGTFELCAPGMLTRTEVAVLMSEAVGRSINAVIVPFEDWAEKAHIPAGVQRDGFERMYANYDQFGFPGGNSLALRAILGHDPRTLKNYLHEFANTPSS